MAYNTLFNNATAGSAFDGTKTLAQLGLTGDGQETISGGALNIVSSAGDYNGVKAGNTLYGRLTATSDTSASANAGASWTFAFREQANGDHYLLWIKQGGGVYVYQRVGNVLTERQTNVPAASGMTGTVTYTVSLIPAAMGTSKFQINQTNGTTTLYCESIPFLATLGAGALGMGVNGGTIAVSALKIEANDAAETAKTGNHTLVSLGDSISAGLNTSNPSATSHPDLDVVGLGGDWVGVNQSVPGHTAALDQSDALYTPLLSQAWTTKAVLVAAGTNDAGTGLTAAQVEANLTALVSDLKAKGATAVFLTTITPRASVQPVVDAVNTWIKAGSSGADHVIDYTANANLTNASNTTYFQGDGLHLTDAGEQQRSISDLAVMRAVLPSTLAGAAITADGKFLTLNLSSSAAGAGLASDFVLSNAASFSASSLSADGLTLTLTLRRRVFVGEAPTLTYAGTSIVGTNQKPVQPFAALAATNNSTRRAFGPPAYLNVAYPGFTWPTVAGATGYRLYQNGILVYDTVNAAGVNTATSFTDPAATDGRPIDQPTFTVSAYDATGEGPQSGTADGTAAVLLGQGTVLVTLTDGAVVNGQTVRLSGPQRVIIDDVRYDVPVGVSTLVPPSVRSVLQNVGLIA